MVGHHSPTSPTPRTSRTTADYSPAAFSITTSTTHISATPGGGGGGGGGPALHHPDLGQTTPYLLDLTPTHAPPPITHDADLESPISATVRALCRSTAKSSTPQNQARIQPLGYEGFRETRNNEASTTCGTHLEFKK